MHRSHQRLRVVRREPEEEGVGEGVDRVGVANSPEEAVRRDERGEGDRDDSS